MHGQRGRNDGGFVSIAAYAALGDGRSLALVAIDGSIDWLVFDGIDSSATLAGVLDPDRGGRFELRPTGEFTAERHYADRSNVLETTYRTATGSVRVTDSVNQRDGESLPWFELARRVEGLAGTVEMRWRLAPRFDFGREGAEVERRGDVVTFRCRGQLVGVAAFADGRSSRVAYDDRDAWETFTVDAGHRHLVALVGVTNDVLPVPRPDLVDARIDTTVRGWQRWTERIDYDGEWHDAVLRSALALKLLTDRKTGAIAAAPTTSLPERIGGDRNWDYRYAWLRDSSFALDALMRLDLRAEAHASASWLLAAVARTHPWMPVLYGLDRRVPDEEQELTNLAGYRGSRPVRVGNAARTQLQLATYGHVLDTVAIHLADGNVLRPGAGDMLARTADYVCEVWDQPDAGIWEVRDSPEHFTFSKIGCWVALDRARQLAEAGHLPARTVSRWCATAERIRGFVDARCWSDSLGTFVASADSKRLDAACLLASRAGFVAGEDPRMTRTIDAIRARLGDGPFLYRTTEMVGNEGAFVACSFWLVEALARAGRLDEAASVMDAMVAAGNDLGLLAEEVDPVSRALLGNFPQGLSHLALVVAACVFTDRLRATRGEA